MCNQAFRFAQLFADDFHNLDILLLVVPADVVNLAHAALVDNQVNRLAVIFHIQPVADIQAFAVDRQRLIRQRVDNHQRNQFFRKMIRPVVVGAAGN